MLVTQRILTIAPSTLWHEPSSSHLVFAATPVELSSDLRRDARHEHTVRNVLCHYGAGADHSADPDSDARQEIGTHADRRATRDSGPKHRRTVVTVPADRVVVRSADAARYEHVVFNRHIAGQPGMILHPYAIADLRVVIDRNVTPDNRLRAYARLFT